MIMEAMVSFVTMALCKFLDIDNFKKLKIFIFINYYLKSKYLVGIYYENCGKCLYYIKSSNLYFIIYSYLCKSYKL